MPEIWAPQGHMQTVTNLWQMQRIWTYPIMKMSAERRRAVWLVRRTILHSLKHVIRIKKENEITQVKYKRNISFPDAWKIMESSIGTQSYASVSQNRIQQIESKQENKYLELIEKLVRLSENDRPNFQERLRKAYHGTREESKRPETDNEAKTE